MTRRKGRRYGLIFDVDGVIADTEAVNAAASTAMFTELFGLEGVRREDFDAGLGRGAEAYVQAAAGIHGLVLAPEQVDEATHVRQRNFLALLREKPLPPFPGVSDLINAALEHEDFEVGIATSSTREKSQAVLESASISYSDVVYVTGSDVSHKKPHPELFLTAAERMEIAPSQCVVIEDAPNGVEAAHSAGCKCVAVTNSISADGLVAADSVVASLIEVTLETIVDLLAEK